MDWITENIAIGNYLDAAKAHDKGISSILCLRENCCSEDNELVDVLAIPLLDGPGNQLRNIKDALDYIDEIVKANENILVHCHAGRSRSVCIVARYLMESRALTSHQALSLIESIREIYLSNGIEEILYMPLK